MDELQQGDLQEPGEAEEKGAWMRGRLGGGGRRVFETKQQEHYRRTEAGAGFSPYPRSHLGHLQGFKGCRTKVLRAWESEHPAPHIWAIFQVEPFASLSDAVRSSVPRLLINRDLVGSLARNPRGRDVVQLGDVVHGVKRLVELLGWTDDIQDLIQRETGKVWPAAQSQERSLLLQGLVDLEQSPVWLTL